MIIYQKLKNLFLNKVFHLNSEINSFYDSFSFNKVFQAVLNFCNVELSSFFDIRKDSLYCDSLSSEKNKINKICDEDCFEYIIEWLSPIIPFTTEEAWQCWRLEVDKNAEELSFIKKGTNVWIFGTIKK